MLLDEARGQKLFEFSYAKPIGRRPGLPRFGIPHTCVFVPQASTPKYCQNAKDFYL